MNPRMSAFDKCMVEIATRMLPVIGLAHELIVVRVLIIQIQHFMILSSFGFSDADFLSSMDILTIGEHLTASILVIF